MLHPPTKFEVRRLSRSIEMMRFGLSINLRSDFDLFTLKLVRVLARGVGNCPTNFGVSGTFPSRLTVQHLSDEPRYLFAMTFYFEGHDACR